MAAPTRKKQPYACGGKHERAAHAAGYLYVAGADEVGRGALFGPVFAAAVVLSPNNPIRGLRDSKELAAERREVLAARIRSRALCWAVASADVYEVDRINILQASRLAIKRAILKLEPCCDYILADAVSIDLPLPQQAIIHGDAQCQCIAAASIIAKTARDECMRRWDEVFPAYGLARNKGYGTDEHHDALRRLGPTHMHRFSFEPVRLSCQLELWSGYDQKEEGSPQHVVA